MEEKQDQVVDQTTQPATEEAQPVPSTEGESKQDPVQETSEQINLRALRELKEKAERERDEALKKAMLLEAQYKQKEQPQQQEVELPEYAVAPDDLVEGKHLSAVDKKIQKLQQQLQSYQQQTTTQTIEAKLKTQFPDFDQVVSKENIEVLKTAYPELATAIGASTDLYSKGSAAYTLIKKFGIHQNQNYTANVDKVKQNLSKPVPTASLGTQAGESPLTKANAFAEGLTPDLKKQLYREMIESSKEF